MQLGFGYVRFIWREVNEMLLKNVVQIWRGSSSLACGDRLKKKGKNKNKRIKNEFLYKKRKEKGNTKLKRKRMQRVEERKTRDDIFLFSKRGNYFSHF